MSKSKSKQENSGLKKFLKAVIIIVLIVFLLGTAVSYLQQKFNISKWFSWLHTGETVERDPLANGAKALSNGGLTINEIEKLKQDNDRPAADDVFRDFVVIENDKYVVLYRKVQYPGIGEIYPNISFVKTSKGLIWDGAWGITANVKTNWLTGKHDWETINFDVTNKIMTYNLDKSNFFKLLISGLNVSLGMPHDNIVTFSSFYPTFCPNFYKHNSIAGLFYNQQNEINKLYNATQKFLMQSVLVPYFQDLTDLKYNNNKDEHVAFNRTVDAIELGYGIDGTAQYAISMVNSYATHLWRQTQTQDKSDNEKFVDLSDYFQKYIKESEQSNYPIPVEKQSEYEYREFYAMYKCSVIANVKYHYDDVTIPRNSKEVDKAKDDPDVGNVSPLPEVTEQLAQLTITLNNKDNSDLSELDMKENPVIFHFGDKQVVFDNKTQLAKNVALEINKLHGYTITSDGLVFTSYSGTVTLSAAKTAIEFEFTYQNNFVQVSVALLPISSVPSGMIDLAANPVKIIFTGTSAEGAHSFDFDDNSKLNIEISKTLKKGTYTYTILSNQLQFNETSGTVTVTATERNFMFNYFIEYTTFNIGASVNAWINADGALGKDFYISLDSQLITVLRSSLGDNYIITLEFFNMFNELLFTQNWTASNKFVNSNETLTHGTSYRGRIKFTSATDNELIHIGDLFSFTYDSLWKTNPNTVLLIYYYLY